MDEDTELYKTATNCSSGSKLSEINQALDDTDDVYSNYLDARSAKKIKIVNEVDIELETLPSNIVISETESDSLNSNKAFVIYRKNFELKKDEIYSIFEGYENGQYIDIPHAPKKPQAGETFIYVQKDPLDRTYKLDGYAFVNKGHFTSNSICKQYYNTQLYAGTKRATSNKFCRHIYVKQIENKDVAIIHYFGDKRFSKNKFCRSRANYLKPKYNSDKDKIIDASSRMPKNRKCHNQSFIDKSISNSTKGNQIKFKRLYIKKSNFGGKTKRIIYFKNTVTPNKTSTTRGNNLIVEKAIFTSIKRPAVVPLTMPHKAHVFNLIADTDIIGNVGYNEYLNDDNGICGQTIRDGSILDYGCNQNVSLNTRDNDSSEFVLGNLLMSLTADVMNHYFDLFKMGQLPVLSTAPKNPQNGNLYMYLLKHEKDKSYLKDGYYFISNGSKSLKSLQYDMVDKTYYVSSLEFVNRDTKGLYNNKFLKHVYKKWNSMGVLIHYLGDPKCGLSTKVVKNNHRFNWPNKSLRKSIVTDNTLKGTQSGDTLKCNQMNSRNINAVQTESLSTTSVIHENDSENRKSYFVTKDKLMRRPFSYSKTKDDVNLDYSSQMESNTNEININNTNTNDFDLVTNDHHDNIVIKKEKSTDCDSALIPLLCVHG